MNNKNGRIFENRSRSKFEYLSRYYDVGRHCCFCSDIGMLFTSGPGQVRIERAKLVFFYTEHMTCSYGQNSEYAAIMVTSRLPGSVAASGPECVRLAGCAGSENATLPQELQRN